MTTTFLQSTRRCFLFFLNKQLLHFQALKWHLTITKLYEKLYKLYGVYWPLLTIWQDYVTACRLHLSWPDVHKKKNLTGITLWYYTLLIVVFEPLSFLPSQMPSPSTLWLFSQCQPMMWRSTAQVTCKMNLIK